MLIATLIEVEEQMIHDVDEQVLPMTGKMGKLQT